MLLPKVWSAVVDVTVLCAGFRAYAVDFQNNVGNAESAMTPHCGVNKTAKILFLTCHRAKG